MGETKETRKCICVHHYITVVFYHNTTLFIGSIDFSTTQIYDLKYTIQKYKFSPNYSGFLCNFFENI